MSELLCMMVMGYFVMSFSNTLLLCMEKNMVLFCHFKSVKYSDSLSFLRSSRTYFSTFLTKCYKQYSTRMFLSKLMCAYVPMIASLYSNSYSMASVSTSCSGCLKTMTKLKMNQYTYNLIQKNNMAIRSSSG